jgi:hypothetical protein
MKFPSLLYSPVFIFMRSANELHHILSILLKIVTDIKELLGIELQYLGSQTDKKDETIIIQGQSKYIIK